MTNLRILIVEDEMIIARDLQRTLQEIGIEQIEIANGFEEALDLYVGLKPHLVLCDINLEEENDGITLSEKIINELNTHIIFITAHSDQQYLERAAKLNPLNYIVKPFKKEQIIATVQMSMANKKVIEGGSEKRNYIENLTPSEIRILKLISNGLTTSNIAEQLFISKKTVENHRANISRKLELDSKNNSLLTWAIEHKEEL